MGDLEWGVGHRESSSEARSVVATDNDAHYFGHGGRNAFGLINGKPSAVELAFCDFKWTKSHIQCTLNSMLVLLRYRFNFKGGG